MLVVAACLYALIIELPYYAISPGSARPTEPTVSVEGAPSYPAGDDILFTTVSIGQRRVNGFEWLEAKVSPNMDLVPAELIDGGQSREENQQLNQQLMDASEDTAVVVALEHLGYDVVSGTGATIAGVVPDTPADGRDRPRRHRGASRRPAGGPGRGPRGRDRGPGPGRRAVDGRRARRTARAAGSPSSWRPSRTTPTSRSSASRA